MISLLQLFRWPNLLVIAITQYLVRYAIIEPLLQQSGYSLVISHTDFALLVLSTLLISAAGYAINDYFDLRTDRINKPEKSILGKSISRRTAILYHSLFNILALGIGLYLSIKVNNWNLVFFFIIIPALLWMYSIRYKRKFLIGNIIVAILAAFVIALVWVFEYHALLSIYNVEESALGSISMYTRVYAIFAFLATWAREIIKDIEDIKGDAKIGCKTIPIIWGIRNSKKLIVFILIGLFAFIAGFQYYISGQEFDLVILYLLIMVQFPVVFLIHKTLTAREKTDYHKLSRFSKGIMVAGMFSMILIYFYFQQVIVPK